MVVQLYWQIYSRKFPLLYVYKHDANKDKINAVFTQISAAALI